MFALSNIFNSISWRFYPCHIFEAPLLMCAFHSQGLEPITGMSFYMYTKQKPWLQIFNSTCWTSLPAPFASWSLGKSSHKTLALCLLCKYESYKCVCITLLFTLASGFFCVRSPENFHTQGMHGVYLSCLETESTAKLSTQDSLSLGVVLQPFHLFQPSFLESSVLFTQLTILKENSIERRYIYSELP